jgi:nicotinate-nucleotide adenylyltransferase
MERIIIFGGSFDPIHNGHLRLARAASLLLNADVVFVPAKDPRWKKPEASPIDRLAMLKKALDEDGSGAFSISLSELARPGNVSYSIDTVHEFHKIYPNRELYLLIGADEANRLAEWKDPDELASLSQIVYIPRPEITVDPVLTKRFHLQELSYSGSGNVSSSSIRELQSIDLPLNVLSYIEEKGLYFMKKIAPLESEKRLRHSLSVAHLALAIAKKNQILNPEKAYIAGLLHDLGKSLSEKEAREKMKDAFPEYVSYPSWCLHQFTGVLLAQELFHITDEGILDAIHYHCTGKAHMPPLSKIIYAADKIEPTRGYDSSKLIAKCLQNYYVGFVSVLKENESFLQKEGHLEKTPLSEECADCYLRR